MICLTSTTHGLWYLFMHYSHPRVTHAYEPYHGSAFSHGLCRHGTMISIPRVNLKVSQEDGMVFGLRTLELSHEMRGIPV
ncbi:uncharacterized protein Bfra_007641 [Botrytis fragariae]|uniref:Uncharacterized protein n=1 Tax=Botrytis fragariae TaxID=1964551 RepID=A0A8H6EGB9_9HELO|nr:uncharacterized protein Bfra_007641 [Botrytis fragariae]KAF5871128.1 hypothetical protein Bfra_007641 [Botrytis fragariae]